MIEGEQLEAVDARSQQIADLEARVRELEETLDAIRSGEVDAIVVTQGETNQVYALEGADHPFRILVENLQEGTLSIAADGTILYGNAAFVRMRGYPLEHILGSPLQDQVAGTDRERFEGLLGAAVDGPVRADLQRKSGEGSMPVIVSLTPLEVKGETIFSVVVTDRWEDSDRLRLQGRMLDAVADAVIATGPDGRILYWNESATRTYGRDASEAIGRTLDEVVAPEYADGEPPPFPGTGETWSGEYLVRHRDGRQFPVHAHDAPVFGEDGRLVAVISASHDISERALAEEALRESAERYRTLIENSIDAVMLTAPDGSILAANTEACRIFGMTEEELVEADRDAIIDPTDPRLALAIEERARTGRFRGELTYRRRDGTLFPGEVATSLFHDRDGAPRTTTIIRVIMDRKENEAALRDYAGRLGRSNEELLRFAYVASHDLQEPLRSIVSFSQLLERRHRGRLDSDADDYIGFIVEGGNRMQRLIEDLLQLSRVETRAKPPVPSDANTVAADAIRAIEAMARDLGAALTVGPLPTVLVDPPQLEQVFVNLVANALKYRRDGVPPDIRVSARPLGTMVEFAVADNGSGIEAQYFDRICEMFQRLHTREEFEGTGIGLAVVKKIVERHGGTVRVESTPGEGSTFLFTLPSH